VPEFGDRDLREICRDQQSTLNTHDRQIAENRHDMNNLRQIIELKLEAVQKDVAELTNILKWAGGLIVSLMLSFMGWALLQQYNANEAQKRDLQQQVQLVRQQQAADARIQQNSERLDASTTQPAAPANSGR
jgi:hypothetical protein